MQRTCKLIDGHVQLGLPWKFDHTVLPCNKEVALRRLLGLKRRFLKNEALFEKYSNKINEYIECGHASRVATNDIASDSKKIWYIPHHCTGPKFRVVFDCSAKDGVSKKSLNDYLLQGPDHTNRLLNVLVKFRMEPVAIMADIKAMFHQVLVAEEDCDALRFFWWPDDNLQEEPIIYRMNVHVFGATSSPSCASFALNQLAVWNHTKSSPSTIFTVKSNFYVDDLLKSTPSPASAINLIEDLRDLLGQGGFTLTKFNSNNNKVMESIPSEHHADVSSPKDMMLGNCMVNKTLGIWWNKSTDNFEIRVNISSKDLTRRGLLSMLSQLYDPFGWLQPVVLPMKRLMQTLCGKELGWDNVIPESYREKWLQWINDLPCLEEITVPRCFKISDDVIDCQIHCFCDASQLAGYGAVSYIRLVYKDGNISTSFVLGKSRVNPLKFVSVPRLELCAAVLSVKIVNVIKDSIEYHINSMTYWTDSKSVLS